MPKQINHREHIGTQSVIVYSVLSVHSVAINRSRKIIKISYFVS